MSIHIGAEKGEIAEAVLLSGDPLRTKFIAEHMLENATCYTEIRNMLGFTGYYQGQKISVQGTGMGQPSMAIYGHELLHFYGAKQLIRVGTCGAMQPEIKLGEIIIAQGASTDSNINKIAFDGLDFAPTADFSLLYKAYESAQRQNIKVHVGDIFSTDLFYTKKEPQRWKIWAEHGLLCSDMETSALYTLAASAGAQALSILTVSDNMISGASSSTKDREQSYMDMVKVALGAVKEGKN